jgi:hypothetical protein
VSVQLPRDVGGPAGLSKGGRVFFPRVLIEVRCEKQTGLVFEERVGPYNVSTLQVVDNDLVANRDECLIQAVTAFASSLQHTQSRFPFVRARRMWEAAFLRRERCVALVGRLWRR